MDNIKISVTMSEVKISKENLIKNYNEADKATKKMLEAIFGKDMFQPKDIMARVRTFNDACRELGNEHPFVKEWHLGENLSPNLEAYLQLRIVVAALNEGWEPQFTKDEVRWYPWFWLYTQKELDEMSVEEKRERRMMDVRGRVSEHYAGFGYAYSYYAPSDTAAYVGSRLCLKSEELATYCGKQFIDLWSYFNLG